MADLISQGIRTLAQGAVGVLAAWLLTAGFDFTAEQQLEVVGVLTMVFTAAWAVGTTWLAKNVNPLFSFLSLSRKTPDYDRPTERTSGG